LSGTTLRGIRWIADGSDVALDLVCEDGRPATLTCNGAAGVHVDLQSETSVSGGPMSWQCEWEQRSGRWTMSFDFADRGVLQLRCEGAVLAYDAG
jgi:hypothetical protein